MIHQACPEIAVEVVGAEVLLLADMLADLCK
jgi:hypothetical protein